MSQPIALSEKLKEMFPDMKEEKETPESCWRCKALLTEENKSKEWRYCQTCLTKRQEEEKEKRIQQRQERLIKQWDVLCPALYRNTDTEKLKQLLGQERVDKINAWDFNPIGLIFNGVTGRGKTRAMYLLLKQQFFLGRGVLPKFSSTFSVECQMAFMNGIADQWLENYFNVDILFFDDFGNQKFTDRVEECFFSIVEHRSSHLKPIMITTNYTGETLKEKISGDRANAMIRRLREFSESINF